MVTMDQMNMMLGPQQMTGWHGQAQAMPGAMQQAFMHAHQQGNHQRMMANSPGYGTSSVHGASSGFGHGLDWQPGQTALMAAPLSQQQQLAHMGQLLGHMPGALGQR